MKHLIQHLLRSNREEILRRSLMHCHAHNVHSIMLLECPGKTIRLFVAEPGHTLAGNHPVNAKRDQTIAFHAHRCDLTLCVTRGQICNWLVMPHECGTIMAREYKYRSAIKGGSTIGFDYIGERRLLSKLTVELTAGTAFPMAATDIHTISVDYSDWASWLVFEGREHTEHDDRCWSMTDIAKQEFSGLYKPMDETHLERLIIESGILE